jgi:MYXO-CTERM domain-containing protein
MKRSVFAVAACAGLCVSAMAGTVSGTGSVSLYGRSYNVTSWNINADATGNAAAIFGAEGMTFFGGKLYVSHDHNSNRANGRLVSYNVGATGDLSVPMPIVMGNGPAGVWGPEGITVNDSGSGYGSFGSADSTRIVGIDSRGSGAFAVFNTAVAGSNGDAITADSTYDDIAFVGSVDKFGVVQEVADPLGGPDTAVFRYVDKNTMAPEASTFAIPSGTKGVAVVSAAFATSLSGVAVGTAQALLFVTEADGFALYDTAGNAISAALTLGDYAALAELESVAVDEVNNLIYLGDEAGKAVHVVAVPAPGALGLLGVAALVAGRRRR